MNTIRNFPIPHVLREIPDPPKKMYIRGIYPENQHKFLTVVGSRKYTPYGKMACERLILGLRGYPVVIISGLALGIDAIAHRSALSAGLSTVAVPGSGLSDKVLYPATNRNLAQNILEAGGALLSEFEPDWRPRPESFPQRNRIMAGLSHAVLVIEAQERSGTLITSRLATEYNRDVFAVPGPINNANSAGPNMLIQKGAQLVQTSEDILEAFGIDEDNKKTQTQTLSSSEEKLKQILTQPMSRDDVIRELDMPTNEANVLISSLLIKGLLIEQLGFIEWAH